MSDDERTGGLLAWQWRLYPDGHRDHRNLLVHALTNPLFLMGTMALPMAIVRPWSAVAGLLCMVSAIAIQGRTHKLEATAPVPFRGPGDVVARIFVEQWVTFPRYVFSGRFARAWRGESPAAEH